MEMNQLHGTWHIIISTHAYHYQNTFDILLEYLSTGVAQLVTLLGSLHSE